MGKCVGTKMQYVQRLQTNPSWGAANPAASKIYPVTNDCQKPLIYLIGNVLDLSSMHTQELHFKVAILVFLALKYRGLVTHK